MIKHETELINQQADEIRQAREELARDLADPEAIYTHGWRSDAKEAIGEAARAAYALYSRVPMSTQTDHLRVVWWLVVQAGQILDKDQCRHVVAERLRQLADDLDKYPY